MKNLSTRLERIERHVDALQAAKAMRPIEFWRITEWAEQTPEDPYARNELDERIFATRAEYEAYLEALPPLPGDRISFVEIMIPEGYHAKSQETGDEERGEDPAE